MTRFWRALRSIIGSIRRDDKRNDKKWAYRYDELKKIAQENRPSRYPPFYCGMAFCGHSTMEAAADCWADRCAGRKPSVLDFY